MRKAIGFAVLALLVTCGIVRGDGKYFYTEKVPVGVPYQRAILMYDQGKETLILQSQYKTDWAEDVNSIAWVVPVPNVPELASADARLANNIFLWSSFASPPIVIGIVEYSIIVLLLLILSYIIEKLIKWVFKKEISFSLTYLSISWRRVIIAVLFFYIFISAFLMSASLGISDVEVVKAETVGVYDIKVIKGQNGKVVTEWLKENGFGYGEGDSKVLDEYSKKGWCFVTAKVNKEMDKVSERAISRGLPAPLMMRFDSNEPVYPMALTGVTKERTEILLYVLSNHKMDCGGRLKLEFFMQLSDVFWNWIRDAEHYQLEPKGFFDGEKAKSWTLCKFKGKLKPEQMKEDIIFKQAKDDKPYRAIKFRF